MATDKLLIVDDETLICWSFKKHFEKEGFDVLTAGTGNEGISAYREACPDIVFLDVKLPDKNGMEVLKEIKEINREAIVVIITAFGGVESAVKAIKDGAYDYIEKPFEFDTIKLTINRAMETARLKKEVGELRREKSGRFSFASFITKSPNMLEILELARKIAESDNTTVLLQGESGTGKDLLAKIIHFESGRAAKPFMEISCTALPETLIESEIFGFEKGAFTDAKQSKKGLFELAEGGTVYLDEIGDVKLSTQVKLLRVLEERHFKHIGGDRDISINVRIIAATNKNLDKEVELGKFREDLFYRLKVIPIYVPPLRERKDDIIPITKYIISQLNREFKKTIRFISDEAEKLLLNYSWPGNVRELRNSIERVMILSNEDTILPEHLPAEIKMQGTKTASPAEADNPEQNSFTIHIPDDGIGLTEVERELIKQALNKASGNQTKAARLLKISRDVLRYRIQKLNI